MKVAIIGGGPSGLYLGILLKRRAPDWTVEVIEQNEANATFGFGVVLADTGLQQLRAVDEASCEAMVAAMHWNSSQEIVQAETPIRVGKEAKGGAIARLDLLSILQAQAGAAGVRMHFGGRIGNVGDLARHGLDDADVVVGADGVNSTLRAEFQDAFGMTRRVLTNHFAWYGTRRVFERPALVFRKWQGGHFVAHYYPYTDSMSTFVAECDDGTWQRCGLDAMDDGARQALFETIFAKELAGEPLLSNNSIWRQFPVIRNAHWHCHDRYVLIGDALASAHFSIGSGTRIAMTDSIALTEALLAHPEDVGAALRAYQQAHAPQKAKLIDASERSFDWYERIAEWMDCYSPEEFVYRFMTRTGRIDDERLRRAFPELMERLAAAGVKLGAVA
jgi:2-polyprenyl-6-methoxyphenol hydroxylase-like FAD-dependent oxidoreductase